MPFGDGTGPLGLGPRTGRGLGYCAGFGAPGFLAGRGWGRGFRFRWRGRGFGWRWAGWFYPPYRPLSTKEERDYLEREIEALRTQTADLEKRLEELKKSEEK